MTIKRPVLFAGAGVMLLSFLLKINLGLFLTFAVAFFLSALALSFVFKAQRLQITLVAFVFLMFIFAGSFANGNVNFARQNVDKSGEVVVAVTGVNKSKSGYWATGTLKSLNGKGLAGVKISLYIGENLNGVERGDKIIAEANLALTENNNHSFSQNIYLQGFSVNITDHKKCVNPLEFAMGKLQNAVRKAVTDNLSGRTAQFVLAVIVGDSSGIDDITYANMKISGILHMVVVSGTHFTTVCAAVMVVLGRLFPRRKVKGVITLAVIFFIMLFCGFSMPVVRSGIAYFILTMAIFLDREGDSLCALAATTTLILFACPYGAYSVSLLLTLSATFGILVLTPIINGIIKADKLRHRKTLYDVINVIVVSLSANITTLPILMYTFHRISLVSLRANLLINYSGSAVLVLRLVAVISEAIAFVSKPLFLISGLLSNYSLWAIDFCANLPFSGITVDGEKMAAIAVMVYAVAALIYFVFIKRKKRGR